MSQRVTDPASTPGPLPDGASRPGDEARSDPQGHRREDYEADPAALAGGALTPDLASGHSSGGGGDDAAEASAVPEPDELDSAEAAASGRGRGPGEEPVDRYLGGRPGDPDTPSRELADADVLGDRSYRVSY
ncbi:MAG TPA: hypothetical protein VF763_06815 [Candidatus Limnocylindrales bacterium]